MIFPFLQDELLVALLRPHPDLPEFVLIGGHRAGFGMGHPHGDGGDADEIPDGVSPVGTGIDGLPTGHVETGEVALLEGAGPDGVEEIGVARDIVGLRDVAGGVDVLGRWSSWSRRPGSPSCRRVVSPAWTASSVCGRTPTDRTTMSQGISRLSVTTPVTRLSPVNFRAFSPVNTSIPRSSIRLLHDRGRLGIEDGRHHLAELFQQRGLDPPVGSG